ncbi:hypothetical protein RCL1_000187 [Eukaryota sp. TZLM3-RCL]
MSSPFGIVLSGRPIVTSEIQQVAPDRFLYQFDNAAAVKNIAIFLTGSIPLPPGLAASVFVSGPPGRPWNLLGAITNDRPSAVFPLDWQQSIADGGNEFVGQIGIFIGQVDLITSEIVNKTMQQVHAQPLLHHTVDQIGQKMLKDFSNYVSSFAKDAPDGKSYVDVSVIDRWVQNFERRCRMNPKFWTDLQI